MRMSEQINELAEALAKAQGLIENAHKDSVNPHFKSSYADLASVREAVRKPLADNGLAYTQIIGNHERGVEIETMVLHKSGQFIAGTLVIPVQQNSAQAIGSATSYGRRYSLMAILGIAADDDDGESATANRPTQPPRAQQSLPPRPSQIATGVPGSPPAVKDAAPAPAPVKGAASTPSVNWTELREEVATHAVAAKTLEHLSEVRDLFAEEYKFLSRTELEEFEYILDKAEERMTELGRQRIESAGGKGVKEYMNEDRTDADLAKHVGPPTEPFELRTWFKNQDDWLAHIDGALAAAKDRPEKLVFVKEAWKAARAYKRNVDVNVYEQKFAEVQTLIDSLKTPDHAPQSNR